MVQSIAGATENSSERNIPVCHWQWPLLLNEPESPDPIEKIKRQRQTPAISVHKLPVMAYHHPAASRFRVNDLPRGLT